MRIEGVQVDNPTAVWTQLMNVRHNVLNDQAKWHPKTWFEATRSGNKMCLANAVRFVTRGETGHADDFGGGSAIDQAERLVLAAIVKVSKHSYPSIPDFNDENHRRHAEIVQVLDAAIAMVKPHARQIVLTFADDMPPEEKKEIDRQIRIAEDEIWKEQVAKWGVHLDAAGTWRNRDGQFAHVPEWVRRPNEPQASDDLRRLDSLPPVRVSGKRDDSHFQPFGDWLTKHKKRGWDTFWDELLDCPEKADDPLCEAAKQALERV
jgi:hypothetical protein